MEMEVKLRNLLKHSSMVSDKYEHATNVKEISVKGFQLGVRENARELETKTS